MTFPMQFANSSLKAKNKSKDIITEYISLQSKNTRQQKYWVLLQFIINDYTGIYKGSVCSDLQMVLYSANFTSAI